MSPLLGIDLLIHQEEWSYNENLKERIKIRHWGNAKWQILKWELKELVNETTEQPLVIKILKKIQNKQNKKIQKHQSRKLLEVWREAIVAIFFKDSLVCILGMINKRICGWSSKKF